MHNCARKLDKGGVEDEQVVVPFERAQGVRRAVGRRRIGGDRGRQRQLEHARRARSACCSRTTTCSTRTRRRRRGGTTSRRSSTAEPRLDAQAARRRRHRHRRDEQGGAAVPLALDDARRDPAPDHLHEPVRLVRLPAAARPATSSRRARRRSGPGSRRTSSNMGDYNGTLYAINNGNNDFGVFYNKVMFKQAGLPTNWAPKNWNDILTAADGDPQEAAEGRRAVARRRRRRRADEHPAGHRQPDPRHQGADDVRHQDRQLRRRLGPVGRAQLLQDGLLRRVSARRSRSCSRRTPSATRRSCSREHKLAIAIAGANWFPSAWVAKGSRDLLPEGRAGDGHRADADRVRAGARQGLRRSAAGRSRSRRTPSTRSSRGTSSS